MVYWLNMTLHVIYLFIYFLEKSRKGWVSLLDFTYQKNKIKYFLLTSWEINGDLNNFTKKQWSIWKSLILILSFQAGGPNIPVTNLCYIFCQFVNCISFSWEGEYWICNCAIFLNGRNWRSYYSDSKTKAEVYLNVLSLLHIFAISCCCSAVTIFKKHIRNVFTLSTQLYKKNRIQLCHCIKMTH